MLTAAALRAYTDEVTVHERDALPAGPTPRKGLPQARHAHVLWSGGARAIDALLPGSIRRLREAGAHRIPLPSGVVSLSPQGWFRRWPETHFLIACSRDLIDWTVRDQLAGDPGITVRQRTEVLGLAGGADRVTGVRTRDSSGVEQVLDADFVVDASGRGSRVCAWLRDLGVPPVRDITLDTGLVYASRTFLAPTDTPDWPLVNVQARVRERHPARTATILPIEDGRWLVTLSGTVGGHPTSDADAFELFARGMRHPVVADLIARAEPVSGVSVTRSTVNRRRHFEKSRGGPEGLVVLGDSLAAFNPVYGHGMSVAALGALALRDEVAASGIAAPGVARRAQRAASVPVDTAWRLAIGQDVFVLGAHGRRPTPADRLMSRYVDRLMLTAIGNPRVARALNDVMMLEALPTALVAPAVALAVLRGPGLAALAAPPFTVPERAVVDGPTEEAPSSQR
ncbi:FAD-dependent oxidoreductase [Streptomyces sp. NPDC002004]